MKFRKEKVVSPDGMVLTLTRLLTLGKPVFVGATCTSVPYMSGELCDIVRSGQKSGILNFAMFLPFYGQSPELSRGLSQNDLDIVHGYQALVRKGVANLRGIIDCGKTKAYTLKGCSLPSQPQKCIYWYIRSRTSRYLYLNVHNKAGCPNSLVEDSDMWAQVQMQAWEAYYSDVLTSWCRTGKLPIEGGFWKAIEL